MINQQLVQEISSLPLELQVQVSDYVAFLRQRYEVSPKNEDADLFEQEFLRQPESELNEDFWNLPRPQVDEKKLLKLIRAERDED